MKVSGGGFDQCYNGQAVVDTESMLILAEYVTQAGQRQGASGADAGGAAGVA